MKSFVGNNSIKLSELSLLLIFAFSGFYLTRIVSLSPVYVTFLIGALLFIIRALIIGGETSVKSYFILPLIYFIYLSVSQPFLYPDISSFIAVLFSLVNLLMGLVIVGGTSDKYLLKVSTWFIFLSFILLLVEGVYRISHPIFILPDTNIDYREKEGLVFYAYKFNSIMYKDSNFVGIFALVVYFFMLTIRIYTSNNYYIYRFALPVLIIMTLSRAAIMAMLLFGVLLALNGLKLSKRSLFYMAIFSCIGVLVSFMVLANDPSFLTKFDIIDDMIQYLNKASMINLFFGVGLGNTFNTIGIGAHNFFVTYIIETGIIGFFLQLTLLITLLIKSKYRSWPILGSFLLAGQSLAGHAIPFLYLSLMLVTEIDRRASKGSQIFKII